MQMKISKKQILRVSAFVMALCLMVLSFTACGKTNTVARPYKSYGEAIEGSTVLASNSDYKLEWDSQARAIVLKHKDGAYWSDIFYEAFLADDIGTNGSSPIFFTVLDTKTLTWSTVSSASQMDGENGYINCKIIDNGIRVCYFFERYKIMIPVEYRLDGDHITVTVDSSMIFEDGVNYKLVNISVNPNLCKVLNKEANANLFVPTGTGALMSGKETAQGVLSYEAPVYGADPTSRVPISRNDNEEIRMPVFGAYSEGKGLLAVIESNAGAATIKAEAANHRTGYSIVYPNFYVRGYDSFMYEYYGQDVFQVSQRVNDEISGQVFTVSYYPLVGEDADYNGMAKKYQSYLIEKGQLKKSEAKQSPYSVTFLGGTNVTKSFFGIPYQKVSSLTTFSEAKAMLEKLKADNGVLPQVRLLGYSDNGLRPGSIAGGKKYLSVYGKKKDLTSLIDYCKDTNLFLDLDVMNYTKSGNGFSLIGDVAKTAIQYKAEVYPLSPTRVQDADNVYYLLGRDNLVKAGSKALKKADKYSANAVSFGSLGEYSYSDYKNDKYINRFEMEKDVATIFENAKKNGLTTAVAGGNTYAACVADMLFDVSATTGDYDVFSATVPFYQMVFHSYMPIYSDAVNTANNLKLEVAKSVAYGMGVNFCLTDSFVADSDDFDEYKLYATVFEDNVAKINDILVNDKFIEVYNSVADSALVNFEFVNKSVVKSEFENGVVIYTNLSTKAAESPAGKLQPAEYRVG
jgi:hypothetical protein